MVLNRTSYPLISEREYCSLPGDCLAPDVLFIGSAIGSASADYMRKAAKAVLGYVPKIVIAEAGPFDLWGHLGDTPGARRLPYIKNPGRVGGDLTVWGVSTPRPRDNKLDEYPYPKPDLLRRFESMEREMGVHEPIPMSGGDLELRLLGQLRDEVSDGEVTVAPLAINSLGRRYCPNSKIPEMTQDGVKLLAHFRCIELIRVGSRIEAVRGVWIDGLTYIIRPQFVVLAVGAERSIPFIRAIAEDPWPLRCSDHHRIDCHGWLPPGSLGTGPIEQLGVAVLIIELTDSGSGIKTPYHLECKIAPWGLWKKGYMQSSDNLIGNHSDDTIFVQVQAVAAMKNGLPSTDLLNVDGPIPAVMSKADAMFRGEIIKALTRVTDTLGLKDPNFSDRPLLTNHHCYRAFAVGEAVTSEFRFVECSNLYIAPPAAFFMHECDANPTLKSITVAQYAMDDVLHQIAADRMPSRTPDLNAAAARGGHLVRGLISA
jgi:hypothetical protein